MGFRCTDAKSLGLRFNGLLVRKSLTVVGTVKAGLLLIVYEYGPLRMILEYAWHPTRKEEELQKYYN